MLKLSNLIRHSENGDMISEDFARLTREEHKLRYKIAAEKTSDSMVLDVGCGYGYGTHILARRAKFVVGVERNQKAISTARAKYSQNNLQFIDSDFYEFARENTEKFDVLTCFEVIEHVSDQVEFINMLADSLTCHGRIFISTPNAKYTTFYRKNPYHLKELSLSEFESLLEKRFHIDSKLGLLPGSLILIPLPYDLLARIVSFFSDSRLVMPNNRPERSRTMLLSGIKM